MTSVGFPIASTTTNDQIGQHLTESILTLERTIQNVKEDVVNGIAPSLLIPMDPTQDQNSPTVLLTLAPSSSDITTHLTPLQSQLENLKHKLHSHNLWIPPKTPPKSPEYSIIDVSDLASAITLLHQIFQHHTSPRAKAHSARDILAKYKWTWDPHHREFYSKLPGSAYIYLSRWRLDEQRQIWEYVSMHGTDLQPCVAAEVMGSWEDWMWDGAWREWYVDVSDEEGECRIYASGWEAGEERNIEEPWTYMGGIEDE